MADVIYGSVIKIVNGNTFSIKVSRVERDIPHQYEQRLYNEYERIRIEEINVPGLSCSSGERDKKDLERAIKGKFVCCHVRTRDEYGRLLCKVSIAKRP